MLAKIEDFAVAKLLRQDKGVNTNTASVDISAPALAGLSLSPFSLAPAQHQQQLNRRDARTCQTLEVKFLPASTAVGLA